MRERTAKVRIGDGADQVEVLVRSATQNDLHEIVALSRTTDRFRVSPYTGFEVDRGELAFWIDDDRSIVLVATEAGRVIGYAYGVCVSPRWFFFDGFVVAPDVREMGVGKTLYADLVERCRERGLQLIQGLVKASDDSSLEYWVERGFEPGTCCTWVEHWIDEE